MKRFISILLLAFLTIGSVDFSYSQTYTTTSKNCGKCGKSVSANSKVGDKCPHCGVIWGKENSHSTTSTSSSPKYPSSSSEYLYRSPIKSSSKGSSEKRAVKEEVKNSTATKAETENWILEKLRTNTPKKYYEIVGSIDGYYPTIPSSGWYNMNYSYLFDNTNLIIEYEQERGKKTEKYRIKIPIYDIDKVYDYRGELWITTKKETIIQYNLTDNTKRVQDYFSTDFNVSSETELCERIQKAFLHLKKFYKKPTSTEPF